MSVVCFAIKSVTNSARDNNFVRHLLEGLFYPEIQLVFQPSSTVDGCLMYYMCALEIDDKWVRVFYTYTTNNWLSREAI